MKNFGVPAVYRQRYSCWEGYEISKKWSLCERQLRIKKMFTWITRISDKTRNKGVVGGRGVLSALEGISFFFL